MEGCYAVIIFFFVIVGSKKYKEWTQKELEVYSLKFADFDMKEKEQDVYSRGLTAGVEATVGCRMGRMKAYIYETAPVIKDWRM